MRVARFLFAATLLTALVSRRGGGLAEARTLPTEVPKLLELKKELLARGLGPLLDSWLCPPEGECDPCGADAGSDSSWGSWAYIACRSMPEEERASTVRAAGVAAQGNVIAGGRALLQARFDETNWNGVWGLVTNIHLSDLRITGTLESFGVLCLFGDHLRELDMDGHQMTGPIPRFISECFPKLNELDLSFGRLTGDIPSDIWGNFPDIEEVKLQVNRLTGTIPSALADLPNLRVLRLSDNNLRGTIPAAFGDTDKLRRIIRVNLEDNPSLCGPIPSGLAVNWRWQLDNQKGQTRDWLGYCEERFCGISVTDGTSLGEPCPDPGWVSPEAECGRRFDQCGGTVEVEAMSSRRVNMPFLGKQCCRRGFECVDVGSDDPGASFSQCKPVEGVRIDPVTEVPVDVIAEYRLAKGASALDCSPAWEQCGGRVNYLGPRCCEGAAPCVRFSPYYSQCDPSDCAGPREQCGGTSHDGGPECCRDGLECVMQNAGYHQCLLATELNKNRFERDSKTFKLRPLDALNGGEGEPPRSSVPRRDPAGPNDRKCIPEWGQCGGYFFEPFRAPGDKSTCCDLDTDGDASAVRCVKRNNWFWACEPCADSFGQCGGMDWTGGACCADAGDSCARVDAFFSQCRPMTG